MEKCWVFADSKSIPSNKCCGLNALYIKSVITSVVVNPRTYKKPVLTVFDAFHTVRRPSFRVLCERPFHFLASHSSCPSSDLVVH